jgi:hypothetical protein
MEDVRFSDSMSSINIKGELGFFLLGFLVILDWVHL